MTFRSSEKWRPVAGYAGLYEVSDQGRVRGRGRWGKEKILSPVKHTGGYLCVNLYRDSKSRRAFVHRLVLEAFVGLPPSGTEACHANGSHADNRLENLRWDSHRSNCADRVAHGTDLRNAECRWTCKLTSAKVQIIRSSDKTIAELATEFGVARGTIRLVKLRQTWRHLP